MKLSITFDVDFVDYMNGGSEIDEITVAFPLLLPVFQKHPMYKATWFIRLDAQIEKLYGSPDYIFQKYRLEFCQLQKIGHEIGWHPHCYTLLGGQWRQNTDRSEVLDELSQYAPLARSYGLQSVRVGWGFHTNETMHLLADLGFVIDSTAIPRPNYPWETTQKDWVCTPNTPYFPSTSDYRITGEEFLPILEIPFSVVPIKSPYDTQDVARYINLAYHPHILETPLANWLEQYSHLITITHPYEIVPNLHAHSLLAFDVNAFESNLMMIQRLVEKKGSTISSLTISEFADYYKEE